MAAPGDSRTPSSAGLDRASRVRVSNIRLRKKDGHLAVTFDIGWSDSWREPDGNWDAAWTFVKYSVLEPRSAESGPMATLQASDLLRALEHNDISALRQSMGLSGALTISTIAKSTQWIVTQEQQNQDSDGPVEETMVDRFIIRAEPNAKGGVTHLGLWKQSVWNTAKITAGSHPGFPGPMGAVVETTSDQMGVFIYRAPHYPGRGPVMFRDVEVELGLKAKVADKLSLWVFGVEMVYIPEGPFSLGDPRGPEGPKSCFYDSTKAGRDDMTYRVDSEDRIDVARGTSLGKKCLEYNEESVIANDDVFKGPIPVRFPKGYRAFYIMKRQVTQGQYAEFISSLHRDAITARFPYGGQGEYRYSVYRADKGQRIATRPSRACNWLSWADAVAYAAWAGLRPMTELEYEKACRGPAEAVADEYAWGTTNVLRALVITGVENGVETVSGNCNVANSSHVFHGGDGGSGPVRDDAFATPGKFEAEDIYYFGAADFLLSGDGPPVPANKSNRECAGLSYYGVAGLSGNLWEFCVNVSTAPSRSFSGRHGDGQLNKVGLPDTKRLGRPSPNAAGSGLRGGSWYTVTSKARVADRTHAAGLSGVGYMFRSHDTGFRGVRSAPGHEEVVARRPAMPPLPSGRPPPLPPARVSSDRMASQSGIPRAPFRSERSERMRDATPMPGSEGEAAYVRGFQFDVLEGPQRGKHWESTGARCTIGYHPSCDLIIEDPTVSRFHCEIIMEDRRASVRDLGSSNGTVVDGVRVTEAFLKRNSLLRLGRSVMRFLYTGKRNPIEISARTHFGTLIGTSAIARTMFAELERAAQSDEAVLLHGEIGTGKSAAAYSIHLESARRDAAFVRIGCGTIPNHRIETELFGAAGRPDAFSRAGSGTIYIEDIGELSIEVQGRLVAALETLESGIARGDDGPRVVASSPRDLRVEVNAGRFRQDLYYRISPVAIATPPLRHRLEDIPALVDVLLERMGTAPEHIPEIAGGEFFEALRGRAWPGNVSELLQYLEKCVPPRPSS